ncbi:MAG: ferritin-like domain-containing protein [Asgard group archaeon]|nr:ferritin-like domain-containing protein [Asgard group archaeon]
MSEELIEFLEEQIDLEHEIIEISQKSVEKIKNLLVKELIRGVAMDSEKHALLLKALHASMTKPTPLIEDEDFKEIKKTIQKHIDLEAKAIETYRDLLEEYEDDRVQTVVSEIYKDEKRHHDFLKRLLKSLIEKETLTTELLEDWLYKYSPTHGTPGG